MFPLRDDIPSVHTPVVNYGLIALCILVSVAQMLSPDGGEQIVLKWGLIPARVVRNDSGPMVATVRVPVETPRGIQIVQQEQELPALSVAPWITAFTCMFLHGGLMHIVGNMWFLIIFGDNIEDRFGHAPYLLMYLVSGLAASGLQILTDPSSTLPTVGASGAIAGVMGSYFLLYPHARVVTLIPLSIIWQTVLLPAPIFLGIWFVFQIASAAFTEPGMGGVAFWAHVGGFAAGLGITWWGRQAGWLAPPPRRTPAGWSHEHV
ncbi:MAG: rhomboid family intramembrane serine protease [Planctomycetaceae bacterium]